MIALLRYFSHFSVDVDNLNDDDFAKMWGQLQYSLEKTGYYNNG
jgi:hypothetical protein